MANPRVFVSSTCYDLKYIRENLKYFITTLGYEPILSEEGSVFYNPRIHTHDSCLNEVPNCQIFVLIIGGRYGGEFKNTEYSITNAEYKEACRLKIPIFTLVDQAVYNEHLVYSKNKKNSLIEADKIVYPSTDNVKIFEFIDEVRRNGVNNAIVSFRNYNDIEDYLKKQWAGMMFSFLVSQNEEDRVADTLSELGKMNERIELLSEQILKSIGSDESKITVKLYDEMIGNQCVSDLGFCGIKVTPDMIFLYDEVEELIISQGKTFEIIDEKASRIYGRGDITQIRMDHLRSNYQKVKEKLSEILKNENISAEKYLELITSKDLADLKT
jgi:hypothetical protein